MFVNLSLSNSFFSPAIDFVQRKGLNGVVNCLALAILLTAGIYCIAFYFWPVRQIKLKTSSQFFPMISLFMIYKNQENEESENIQLSENQEEDEDEGRIFDSENSEDFEEMLYLKIIDERGDPYF